MDIKEIGQRIKFARMKAKIKQTELAKMLDISRASISGYECGQYYPDGGVLLKLIKILGPDILPDDVRATILPGHKDFERPTYSIYDEVYSLRREVEELRKAFVSFQHLPE